MRKAHTQVLACWGAHLDEFPIDSLFLVEDARTPAARIKSGILRRLDRSHANRVHLRNHQVRGLVNYLNQHPVDLLYTIFAWNAIPLLEVLERLERPIPLVFTVGGTDITAARSFGKEYMEGIRRVTWKSALVLSVSDFLSSKMLQLGAPTEKVVRHYIGVDIPAELVPRSLSNDVLTILAVSRLTPVKGLVHSIRAFSRVAGEIPNSRFEIIGDGEECDHLAMLVKELGLQGRVKLSGSHSLRDVYAAMANADIFVQHNIRMPNGQEEAMSNTILEASAHALPCIVTRSGGNIEGVVDGVTGITIEPGDEEGMAQAIIELARNPDRRRLLGQAGRANMQEHFDAQKQNRRLEDILLSICNRT